MRLLVVLGVFVSLIGFADISSTSLLPSFDSAHSTLLLGTISKGKLDIDVGQEELAPELIRDQLRYFIGPLNAYGAGAETGKAIIKIAESELKDNRVSLTYQAEFLVAWPKTSTAPKGFKSVLPLRVSYKNKVDFFKTYGDDCVSGEEPADPYTMFYYYRPQNAKCRILQSFNPKIAVPVQFSLASHAGQTFNKFPEYHEIWKDGRLTMTFLMGTYDDGATSNKDQGVVSYGQMYRALIQSLGTPYSTNVLLGPNQVPGLQHPDIEMTYRLPQGKELNINLLLTQKSEVKHPSAAFLNRYNQRTEVSDVISYNGHSGLGSNIHALSKLGHFLPGVYQIFMLNGCDTLSYHDDILFKLHGAANPEAAPTKHLDIIVNAMPSQFGHYATNTVALVRALLAQKATYRQILSSFASFQKAMVKGEEDNLFPQPF